MFRQTHEDDPAPTTLAMQTLRGQRVRADLTLLLVAIIWGSAFVAQRVAAASMGVYAFNGLRFLLGGLILLPLSQGRWATPARGGPSTLFGMISAGVLLFLGASLQQLGLRSTTAGNAGFITGLYVVLIPLILAISGRRLPGLKVWSASLLAAGGLFLLSTSGSLRLAPGDALELAGALMWALHMILVGWLVQRAEARVIAVTQYFVCGLLSLGLAWIAEPASLSGVIRAAWAVVYTGIFSIGLGYTLQLVGQKVAPPTDAAIILSSEAVFAALAGWLFLDERLTAIQLLGCGLMLAAMLLAQWRR